LDFNCWLESERPRRYDWMDAVDGVDDDYLWVLLILDEYDYLG